MSEKKEAPLLLTVREVSALLRVQRPKVYELIKDGAIDGFKVGADWRIRRDSVENLIGAIPENFFDREVEEDDEDDLHAV
jgi:excisionase family DNA binding protein